MVKNVTVVFTKVAKNYTQANVIEKLKAVRQNQATNLSNIAKSILDEIITWSRVGLFLKPTTDQVDQVYVNPARN